MRNKFFFGIPMLWLALTLPITGAQAQDVEINNVQIDGLNTNIKCLKGALAGVPIQFIATVSNMNPNCPTIYTVTPPNGIPVLTTSYMDNGNQVINAGFVDANSTYQMTGEYTIDVQYNCGLHMTLEPEEIFFGSGVANKMSVTPGVSSPDGSALVGISLFSTYQNLMFNADWYNTGLLKGSGMSYTTFTPLNSVVITDPGGCVETYPCTANPTGVPVAPTLNKSGIVNTNTLLKVTNRVNMPGMEYRLLKKNGALWIDKGVVTQNGIMLTKTGTYKVIAKNSNNGVSYSAQVTVQKQCGHSRVGNEDTPVPEDAKLIKVIITDILGKKVLKESDFLPILTRDLVPGTYIQKMYYDNKTTRSKKFVIPSK